MIEIIITTIVKGKSPQQIFDQMRNLNQEKYIQLHPAAHKSFRLIKETKNHVGTIIYLGQTLDGFKVDYKWEYVKVDINLPISFKVKMKAKTFYPIYLDFSGEKINSDTQITHKLNLGFSFKGFEKIFDWFVRRFILTEKKIEALNPHVKEEFKNLENIR